MLTDKEKMELLNLRKRVQAQREEIKKLREELRKSEMCLHALLEGATPDN